MKTADIIKGGLYHPGVLHYTGVLFSCSFVWLQNCTVKVKKGTDLNDSFNELMFWKGFIKNAISVN